MDRFGSRDIIKADLAIVLGLIHELAQHEGRPNAVSINEEQLSGLLFSNAPTAYGIVGLFDGQIIGYALMARKFSSFKGHKIAYIEDILVSEKARGNGLGIKMMQAAILKAQELGCHSIEWSALDDNDVALGFYDYISAEQETGRVHFEMDNTGMKNLLRKNNG
jgi:GNAT superfamily N-acetyltransferase